MQAAMLVTQDELSFFGRKCEATADHVFHSCWPH